ncbi:hypothetical protein QR680_011258 [Steinernema hermaphroditum]|uniref:enoyl-CoA hydratase n=1 Tax=Steinernema hermaphroditum TaxID=289476 RepID=A0AA39IRP1_9BILA|nr:hypothetical protein QR680_011258 [Steinernema hermaphroditum]
MAGKSVSVSIVRDDVCVVRVNDVASKVNALGKSLSDDLRWAFDQIENDDSVHSVVLISGKPDCFFAGADISMLQKTNSIEEATEISRDAQTYFERIEQSKKPVVAAIMGTCMGAGVEIALACHFRIAVNNAATVLSLPEVKLGLLPGAGGTQRLPKLVAVGDALDMMLTGRNVKPKRAKQMGLVDLLVEEHLGTKETHDYLEELAVEVAKGLSNGEIKVKRSKPFFQEIINSLLRTKPALEHIVLKRAKESVDCVSAGHFPAPYEILEAVKNGLLMDRENGFQKEAEAFGRLSQTLQCKALIGLFMGQTACKKNRYGSKQKISRIAIQLADDSSDLAAITLDKGIQVELFGEDKHALEKAKAAIVDRLKRRHPTEFATFMERLIIVDGCDLSESQIVFCHNYEQIEEYIPSNAVAVLRPRSDIPGNTDRAVRLRYHIKNQMAQIIPLPQTNKEAIELVADLLAAQKVMVVKGRFDANGLYKEAVKLVSEGVSPKDVDAFSKAYGFSSGVLSDAMKEGFAVEQSTSSGNAPSVEDVPMRLMCAFVNEAILCVENGDIESTSDMDMLSVAAFGFPAHWGGPCRFVDLYGAAKIVADMERLGMTPCGVLEESARFQ